MVGLLPAFQIIICSIDGSKTKVTATRLQRSRSNPNQEERQVYQIAANLSFFKTEEFMERLLEN